jgi:Uncharacterised nucleotidyltransferase
MSSAVKMPALQAATPKRQSRVSAYTAEFELLLACCSRFSTGHDIGDILDRSLDWQWFLQMARRHGLIPDALEFLSSSKDAPMAALQLLQPAYESNARQALWLSSELVRILHHLKTAGIEALPYKGPVLAELLYGNVARRQFSDLDVLIHPQDLMKAKSALLEIGYTSSLDLSKQQERTNLVSGYECTFNSRFGENLLEMQWQILPRFYSIDFDVDGIFDRSVTVRLGEHSIHTICGDDLMIVLCVHAAKHGWEQVSWLCDIAALAGSVDWAVVMARAQQLGVERIVAVTFYLAERLLGMTPPPLVENRIRNDRAVEKLAHRILPVLPEATDYDTESLAYFRFMVATRERWQDQARFWWRLAVTPSVGEWSAMRLPGPLFPFYRVVRLARLARRMLQPLNH